jgi:heme/copper-type cytochrome/quinol oxidase subunit 1
MDADITTTIPPVLDLAADQVKSMNSLLTMHSTKALPALWLGGVAVLAGLNSDFFSVATPVLLSPSALDAGLPETYYVVAHSRLIAPFIMSGLILALLIFVVQDYFGRYLQLFTAVLQAVLGIAGMALWVFPLFAFYPYAMPRRYVDYPAVFEAQTALQHTISMALLILSFAMFVFALWHHALHVKVKT